MIAFVKIGIIIFCIVFFSEIMGFAQRNDMPNVSTSELSRMDKDQDGLISSSEMQAYQKDKSKNTSRKWVEKDTAKSGESNTQITEK